MRCLLTVSVSSVLCVTFGCILAPCSRTEGGVLVRLDHKRKCSQTVLETKSHNTVAGGAVRTIMQICRICLPIQEMPRKSCMVIMKMKSKQSYTYERVYSNTREPIAYTMSFVLLDPKQCIG